MWDYKLCLLIAMSQKARHDHRLKHYIVTETMLFLCFKTEPLIPLKLQNGLL